MATLYVSDLDGTLLGADSKVSARSALLLNTAISKGALFSVATARTPATVSRLLAEVDCRVPVIVMTGAAVWNPADHTYHHACFHRSDTARRMLALYREADLSAFVYTLGHDNVIHIYHLGPMNDQERQFVADRADTPFKTFHIPDDGESEIPDWSLDRVLLFYSMRPTEEVQPVYDSIKDSTDVRAVFYHDIFGEEVALLEVFSPLASKANAVRVLADMVGANRIAAYGDNVNDLPILNIADDAVAVENAVAQVRAAARRVIGRNTSDAVAADILASYKLELKNEN